MLINDNKYLEIVDDIKKRIAKAQSRAYSSVNQDLIYLYWNVGKIINEKSVWGNKFVDNLQRDIRLSFPNLKGFSARNMRSMAKYNAEYPDESILQTLSAKLSWSANKIKKALPPNMLSKILTSR